MRTFTLKSKISTLTKTATAAVQSLLKKQQVQKLAIKKLEKAKVVKSASDAKLKAAKKALDRARQVFANAVKEKDREKAKKALESAQKAYSGAKKEYKKANQEYQKAQSKVTSNSNNINRVSSLVKKASNPYSAEIDTFTEMERLLDNDDYSWLLD